MTPPRKPTSFRVTPDPDGPPAAIEANTQIPVAPRQPRAMLPEAAVVVPASVDYFAEEAQAPIMPAPQASRRRSWLSTIFFTAIGVLISLAVSLWIDDLIRVLFERNEWLGWTATGVAAIAAVSLLILVAREVTAIWRLASIEALRTRATEAIAQDDGKAARAVVAALIDLTKGNAATAAGRRTISDLDSEIIDGAGLVRLAEVEILSPLDTRARALVLEAAKRVSVVTTVSPRALVDLAYVVFESSRLIRRLAELYGARPGTLGFFRLARSVLSHLAVTGAIAAGDDFVHQVVGQGLAARLSAKLGEGVVNGMMTARIGIAAIETVRPLPFSAVKRPKLTDILSVLTSMTKAAPENDTRR